MSRKRSLLLIQVLSFLLVTLLGVATGNLTSETGSLPWGLDGLRRGSLPLAGVIVVLIIGLMVWQHLTEERLALPAPPLWDSDRSPFPGLEAFTEQDSAVFFGRDAEIAELLDRLHPVVAGQVNRLIAVVGPSGAGKSSLVKAGVIPRLLQRRSGWIVVPSMVPGDHPLRSLVLSLVAAGLESASKDMPVVRFADELRSAVHRPNAPVLVVIDQAEELFALVGEGERNEFLDLLASALEGDQRLWIVLITRTEFLNAFLGTEHARLFRNPVTVGTLNGTALIEVIEQPARRAGLVFDPPDLPQRMAAEAGGGDALPLLAYALQELYLTVGPGKPMTAIAYERIGGVSGVLTRQADKVVTEIGGVGPTGPVLATLLKFVTISEDEPTRRRVRRSALTEEQWQVAEAFLTARLLTSTEDGNDAILEVAHEALFRSWAPLRQAIEASTDQLRWRADLERWAKDWENSGRQDAYLLRDERLEAAQRWAASNNDMVEVVGLVSEFLTCSNRADRATMERLSETIARQALGTVDTDPDYSLVLALAAFEECAPTPLAVRALTAALVASPMSTVLRGHNGWVRAVAWSPSGQLLATASSDRTVRIWDGDSGREIVVLYGHNDWVREVAWSPDGTRLASASSDRTIRIWNPDSGSQLGVLRGHDDEAWGVAWSPDSTRLASASSDRTIRIWNPDNASQLGVLRGHKSGIRGVAWSPDGRQLATASRDRTARIWDPDNGHEVAVLRGHDDDVRDVAWSPDSRRLATVSSDRTVRIWNTDNASELMVLRGHHDGVRGLAWSPNGQRLATVSNDWTARIWDMRSHIELAALYGHAGAVQAVMWSPNGKWLATASADETARIWDGDCGSELLVLRGHKDTVLAVAWSPDSRYLASASDDRTVRIWDTETGNELAVIRGHDDEVRTVAWSPDSRQLATGSRDRTARIWDPNNGHEVAVLRGHDDEVRTVAWSPNSQQLATGSRDQTARIWDARSGNELAVLRGHDDWVQGLAWAPDGWRLATASGDRTARVWDTQGCRQLSVLHGHDDRIRGVAWSPDGQRLATASSDRTVRIWDSESGAEIIVVGTHAGSVESVSWAPDNRRIASASRDGKSRIWDATITIENLLANAHDRVSRELTAQERRTLMLPRLLMATG